jgi:hypothetical protein
MKIKMTIIVELDDELYSDSEDEKALHIVDICEEVFDARFNR